MDYEELVKISRVGILQRNKGYRSECNLESLASEMI